MTQSKVHAVIMAGGRGTRFWPLSRESCPKHLLPITGTRPMLVETVTRLGGFVAPDHMWIVTVASQAEQVRRMVPEIPPRNILVEPVGRNTAPCIGLAAQIIAREDSEAVMLVLPADHHIGQEDEFIEAIGTGIRLALETSGLITLGVKPSHPETAYGYIETGAPLSPDRAVAAYRVAGFHEKPDFETAESYFNSGRYYWNSGIFIWRTDAILDRMERLLPDMNTVLRDAAGSFGKPDFDEVLRREYPGLRSVSIDYGVMEHADGIWMIPADFGWSDVGSWPAAAAFWPDQDGNAVKGRAIALESKGCAVYSPERLVALVGVDDLIVVDTPDALLICARDRAQDVRRIVERLEKSDDSALS